MNITISVSSLVHSSPKEYVLRFALGGLVTVLAGLVAKEFGSVIGGLFLAFPSIFPATVTLIEKHEAQKKEQDGIHGKRQARCAAGADAAGAAMGSFGLLVFGLIVWRWAPDSAPWIVLSSASLAWMIVAVVIWILRKKL